MSPSFGNPRKKRALSNRGDRHALRQTCVNKFEALPSYRISLAVAGFKPDQLNVTINQNTLVVTGSANEKQDEGEYLYKGIAGRPFERRFNLADYVVVKGASIDEGLLQIELERQVPEAMKPRGIEIKTGKTIGEGEKVRTIEHSKTA